MELGSRATGKGTEANSESREESLVTGRPLPPWPLDKEANPRPHSRSSSLSNSNHPERGN